eukprot:scaffold6421_cov251-Ochromonas_danica.AAC.3
MAKFQTPPLTHTGSQHNPDQANRAGGAANKKGKVDQAMLDHGEESSPVRSVLIALAISIIFIDLPLACYEFTTTDVKSSSYGSILITVHFILKVIASLTMALLIVLVSNSRWKKKVPLCSMLKATVSSTFTFATIFKMLHQLDYSHMSEHESSSLARWYQGIDDSLVHEYHGSFCEDCLSLSNFQPHFSVDLARQCPFGSSYRIRHSKEKLLKDSCEEALRLHDQEMKNMVGNVAHDLKTPLSSFKAAIDVIKDVVDGMMSNRDGDGENSSIVEGLHTIKSCAESMFDTNSFMLMSINRCIDYVKASQGLKLQPKLETINLMESLHLPLMCMKGIQERVTISLATLDDQICSDIITDKQWLQENLLCLLSNAVKYSGSDSEVQVRISLVQDHVSVRTFARERSASVSSSGSPRSKIISLKRSLFSRHAVIFPGLSPSSDSKLKYTSALQPFSESSHSSNFQDSSMNGNMESFVKVEVEDTGIGMSEEAMKNLFSAFKQAQRLAGGTGLGLFSLAKRIEALNGKCGVAARSDGQQGSLFWFTFPYRPDIEVARRRSLASFEASNRRLFSESTSDDVAIFQTDAVSSSNKSLERTFVASFKPTLELHLEDASRRSDSVRRVLLVEDSPSIYKMISIMLRRQGFHVTIANNGAEALTKIRAEVGRLFSSQQSTSETPSLCPSFDIILCDLQMPVMDGLEMIRRLRQLELREFENKLHHKVIAISANSDSDVVEEVQRCGFDGFLSKPFSIEAFMQLFNEKLVTS